MVQRLPQEQHGPDHQVWFRSDSVPNASRVEIIPDSPDVHQFSQPFEHVDLLSLLKQAPNKSTIPSGNIEIPGQSNLPDQHSNRSLLNQHIEMQTMHESQQQRLQQLNQPSLSHLSSDHQSSFASNENMHSSAISHDPQFLNLLQQQYLASQLEIPAHQDPNLSKLSFLENILLLKKEQEQKDFLLQQQLYLSQVLSDKQSRQQMNDHVYGHLQQSSFPGVNTYRHPLGTEQHHQHGGFQNSSLVSSQSLQDSHLFNIANLSPQFSQDIVHPVSSMPHLLLNSGASPKELVTQAQQNDDVLDATSTEASTIRMNTLLSSQITYCQNSQVDIIPQPGEKVNALYSEDLEAVTENFNLTSSVMKETSNMEKKSELFWDEPPFVKEIKAPLNSDTNKVLEKKSKKQKKSKSRSTKESEIEASPNKESSNVPLQKKESEKEPSQNIELGKELTKEIVYPKSGVLNKEPMISNLKDTHAWKATVLDVKTKSLKEIQEEEHRLGQTQKFIPEAAAVSTTLTSQSTPWVGIAGSESRKSSKEFCIGLVTTQSDFVDSKFSSNSKTKKNGMHYSPAEILSKSNENIIDVPGTVHQELFLPQHSDSSFDADDFVQAKKNRKKVAKGKLAVSKTSFPVASPDTSHSSFLGEKGKCSRLVQQEKETVSAPSAGPSLGDFVLWKGEDASSVPTSAWSNDAAIVQKATSLRAILKEQEKKLPAVQQHSSTLIQGKVQANRSNHGSTSWNISGSSMNIKQPKTDSLKQKSEDLFWGPNDEAKQDMKL